MRDRQDGRTHEPRCEDRVRGSNTCETPGRKRGSGCQQRWINIHNSSVQVVWVGREGRLPFIISVTVTSGLLLNGAVPVNPCGGTE